MRGTGHPEKKSEYYDNIYAAGYNTVRYQPIYRAILENLKALKSPRVLEVGCGVGDLGKMIVDSGIPYRGFDFSEQAIECSRKLCPEGKFWTGDAYDKANYLPADYNVVIALEVLEHTDDLCVLENIPAGVHIVGSVPNFDDVAHLRVYEDPQRDIVERFKSLLNVTQVFPVVFELPDSEFKPTIYIFNAVRKAATPVAGSDLGKSRLTDSVTTVTKSETKIGRNAPCLCGSGRKYKKCCGRSVVPA